MSKKKKTARKKKKVSKKKISWIFNRWILQLLMILLCVFIAYCIWLDFGIRKEFEGKRWAVPARVYSQPAEIYLGQQISKQTLIKQLKNLGYKPVSLLSGSGQYSVSQYKVNIFLREFRYTDGLETAKKISVSFKQQSIVGIENLSNSQAIQITRLEPELIGKIFPLHDEDRILVKTDEIPQRLIDALIAIEDRRFFEHHGIDPIGILRSIYINLLSGKISQGGSTLTQQLVKNMFLTRERTFHRKINEMLMAVLLDYHYSKEHILAAYVNEVFLGQNGTKAIHGFGTAAEFYFSRPLQELNLEQIALLVGMVKGASYYNPRRHPERALKRRNIVLAAMHNLNLIASSDFEIANKRKLQVSKKPDWSSAKYPAFLELVRRHLKRDYQTDDLRNEGLKVHTTIDPVIQEKTEQNVIASMNLLDKRAGLKKGALEIAVVIISHHDGEILALLGDRDPKQNAFNRALDAHRPIGSLIKPAIYLSALQQADKYNVLSVIDDSPITLNSDGGKSWTPQNYDKVSHGKVPLIRALTRSYNQSTVRLGMQLGLEKVIKQLKHLGVDGDIRPLPSLLLGAIDLSPYQITQMYQTIASDGLQVPLKTVRAVFDQNGHKLKSYDLRIKEYIKPEAVFLTKYLLTQVVENGTAAKLKQTLPSLMPLAGKTGTTNNLRDTWFAGFGDRILGVVWVGRDDNKSTKLTGSTGAMMVWSGIMKDIKPTPVVLFPTDEITWASFPDLSNPPISCQNNKNYPFIKIYTPDSINCF